MEIAHDRWFLAIKQRHSRRQYQAGRSVPPEMWQRLQMFTRSFKPFPCVRLELCKGSIDNVFKGAIGSYGKVKDPPAYMVMIGNTSDPNYEEKTGYVGEALILEAVSMGLATCWIGGFFNPKTVEKQIELSPQEKIMAVSPVGFPAQHRTFEERVLAGVTRSFRRMPVKQFISGIKQSRQPDWMADALEAVRVAPSALNRQPWRLHIESNWVIFSAANSIFNSNISKRLDCGIAMLHFEIAARFHGVQGHWEFLESPLVARFSY
jgi:nitroreductase